MRRIAAVLLAAGLLFAGPAAAADRPFLAYLASWYEPPAARPADTLIARLPGYVGILALGFARPDMIYPEGGELSGSGLQFPFAAPFLREAIATLKKRNPRTRVVVSVGGANYGRWDRYDAAALARLVRDIGADGVDLDYEPSDPGCAAAAGRVACRSDATWTALVARTRAALPRPLLLTVPGWSVGAYGEGAWAAARPPSPWTGSMLALLRAPEAAAIDLVSIMGYDAGPAFDPVEAFRAYRHHWRGPLAVGVQVLPSEVAGSPRFTPAYAGRLLDQVTRDPLAGAMLYGLRLTPPGAVGADNPDAAILASTICRGLGARGCERPLPP